MDHTEKHMSERSMAIDNIIESLERAKINGDICNILSKSSGDRLCGGKIISVKQVVLQSNTTDFDGNLIPLYTLLLGLSSNSMQYEMVIDLSEHIIQFGSA